MDKTTYKPTPWAFPLDQMLPQKQEHDWVFPMSFQVPLNSVIWPLELYIYIQLL